MAKTFAAFILFFLLLPSLFLSFGNSKAQASTLQAQVALFYSSKPIKRHEVKQINKAFDAVAVSQFFLVDQYQKKGITLPVFFISNDQDLKSLESPTKIIFGGDNQIDRGILRTNSPGLYQKYLPQMPPSAPIESTELIELLRPLYPPSLSSGVEGIDYVYAINLDERPERWERVKNQFDLQNIHPYRVSGINGWKIPKEQAVRLYDQDADLIKYPFGGALGCLLSHVSIYKNALEQGFETIWICEDDIEFKQPKEKISLLLKQLNELDPKWDILYTDYSLKGVGIQKPRPGHSFYTEVHAEVNGELVRIHGRLNTHSMIFSKRGVEKVYSYFTHGKLWHPIDVDIHYAEELREYCTAQDIVTSIYDSSVLAVDGSSDTQAISPLNNEK